MKTFGELVDVLPPKADGASLIKLLESPANTLNREYLYWEFPYLDQPNAKFAVRKGKWKGVKEWQKAELQLDNLEKDPEELYNWAKEYPEIIKEMKEIIQKEHQASPFWPLKGED